MKKVKIFSAFLILGSITALNSCKKEVTETANTTTAVPMSSISSDEAIASGTQFGAGLDGSTDQKVTVCNKFGVKYIRSMVTLKNFSGNVSTERSLTQKGFKVVLNINWDNPGGRGDTKNPVPFPTDMVKYKAQLTKLLKAYKPEIAVIENEPTNNQFHSGPIENYITELKAAVALCKQYNVKVADGCTHVPLIEIVMSGRNVSGTAADVRKLITAYKTIDLDYVNVHTQGPTGRDPDVYQPGLLKKVADYLRNQTGKPVMSNEWTVHSTSTALVKSMVSGFKDGGYKIALVRSASSPNGAKPLHKGTSLLPNGVTYSQVAR
jgi:hypothetical protein